MKITLLENHAIEFKPINVVLTPDDCNVIYKGSVVIRGSELRDLPTIKELTSLLEKIQKTSRGHFNL